MLIKKQLIACMALGFLMAAPAFADKPPWAGGGDRGGGQHAQRDKGQGHASTPQAKKHAPAPKHQRNSHNGRNDGTSVQFRFDDRQRAYLHDYYGEQFRAGKCPPGLAKKHNGCMPPGQAKKWRIGYPLGDVIYYDLPASVMVHIGTPPAGYKYVRVAADILMIAVGTGLVVDALADIGRM